jgi:endoglucanase
MKTAAIILAAGRGKRMNADVAKQYLLIHGKPVLYYSLKAFEESEVDEIVLVTAEEEIEYCQKEIVEKYQFQKVNKIVAGGKERYHSVSNGLTHLSGCDYVLIHDGARPFVTKKIIKKQLEEVVRHQAVVAGMPSKDTVKISDEEGFVSMTPNRKNVWTIQTPQTFSASLIQKAYGILREKENMTIESGIQITDDAMVVEHFTGKKVKLVEGSYRNIKITTPEDLIVAEAFLKPDHADYYGALCVQKTHLCDAGGNPVQLKGISTHGIAEFPQYINKDLVKELREKWNANVLRLAMYTAERGGYCTDGDAQNLEEVIDRGVTYCTENDMYVIIDWHILSDGDPNSNLEKAKHFFAKMAEKYKDQENVLYEICNEPNSGTGWGDVKRYAKEIITLIRKKDKAAVILVGTPNWCQYVEEAADDPIREFDNVMYTLHFYAATHKEELRRTMENAIGKGLPVFVSEYGLSEASGNGVVDVKEADIWKERLDCHQISYIAWNLSNKDETSAMIKADCKKLSGFEKSDLTAEGQWVCERLSGKSDGRKGE